MIAPCEEFCKAEGKTQKAEGGGQKCYKAVILNLFQDLRAMSYAKFMGHVELTNPEILTSVRMNCA